jgi:hypothetical protein
MTSSEPSRMTRRTFVGAAVATIGVTAMAGTASASAQVKLDRAVGVAGTGGTVHTLGRTPGGWLLVAADGSSRPTTGLDNADLLDLTGDLTGGAVGFVAVGSFKEGGRDVPAVWESVDGLTWQATVRLTDLDGHLSAVASTGGEVLAMGAHLTLERAPHQRIGLLRTKTGWSALPLTGLDYTREWAASAVAGGDSGWVLSTVDSTGSMIATSPDGSTWSAGGTEVAAAVRSLAFTGAGIRWVANAMGGSGGLTGVVGAGRRPVPVPQDAQALGAIGDQSYWLADGRIISATV